MRHALHDALELIVSGLFPDAPPTVRAALVDEKRRALDDPDAGTAVAVVDADAPAAAVAVVHPVHFRAALLGITPPNGALAAPCAAVLRELEAGVAAQLAARPGRPGGARAVRVVTGGPAGNYLLSGWDADDRAGVAWLAAQGFAETARHVDVRVDLAAPAAADPRVRRATTAERAGLVAWIARVFAPAWGREAARGLDESDGVFVAGVAPAYAGFVAHSGTNAARGTFGPLGVEPEARKGGLGAALTRAALDDLHRRGFAQATILWVDPALVEFYRRQVDRAVALPRVVLAKTLALTGDARTG